MNAWRTGWSTQQFPLVAKLLVPIAIFTHIAKVPEFDEAIGSLGVADMLGYVPAWSVPIILGTGPFPFGRAVFPD